MAKNIFATINNNKLASQFNALCEDAISTKQIVVMANYIYNITAIKDTNISPSNYTY